MVEGRAELEVPDPESFKTAAGDYSPSLAEVFYNPKMEFCRDISVAVAQTSARRLGKLRICDPLAGVGVRGIRYAKEVSGVSKIVTNDRSPKAGQFISRNVKRNRVEQLVEIHQKDANLLLWENRWRFNFIDIDPFGSPSPFLDAACAAMSRQGMLALTATDTAPLCGSRARACIRRYGTRPLRTEYCRELGIRILIGFAQRVAGKHELALTPLLSHATEHYFRIYLWAERGARRSDYLLKNLGYVSHCPKCNRRSFTLGITPELPRSCTCGESLSHAGPLWLGPLGSSEFICEVTNDLSRRGFKHGYREVSLLNSCAEEAGGPPTFYDVNELARAIKAPAPKLGLLMEKLKNSGYFVSRTHFAGTGFRTNAPFEKILGIFTGNR
jgi:tRNA (guanine26-N2/guanine27-N2)-dimethyltransferase